MIGRLKKFIKNNRVEFLVLLTILISAAFLRLYKISDYMTFLGDEGRDVMVAKGILEGNLTLLGPRASAGDFFLGPIYYYMIAPFLLLAGYDPVGPAIMVALFGVATVFLIYYVGRKFFDAKTGLMSAALYSVSPIVIAYSRSSWNPNLMPFASLLIVYCIYMAIKNNSFKLFLTVGFLFGIAIQLHYLTVFLGVIVFFFVLFGNLIKNKKNIFLNLIKQYFLIFSGFIFGISPFLFFEVRHGFPNIRTVFRFVFEDNAADIYLPGHSFTSQIGDVFFRIFGRLVLKFPDPITVDINNSFVLWIWFYGIIILGAISICSIFGIKDKLKVILFSCWIFFGIILFGIYKKPIYDYYFGFMFPLPFLLIGNLLSKILDLKKNNILLKSFSISIFIGILILNLTGSPFRNIPNKQKDQAKNIADFVLSKTNGRPFNFALITNGNSDHVYRYFFEVENRAPVTIQNPIDDPKRKSVTSQLLVICEDTTCQPLGNSLWEVAGFGRAEIVGVWEVPFVKVYKLVPYEGKD